MIDPTVILIPVLFALAVWILQYILRAPDDKKPTGKPGARPGSTRPTATRPARRQTTDLDRYLEETRKQRQQQEEKKPVVLAEVVQESAVDRAEAMERERRKAATPPPPPPPPRPAAPRPGRQPSRIPTVAPEAPRRPIPAVPVAERPVPTQVVAVPLVVQVEPLEMRPSGRAEPIAALDSRRREELRIAAAPLQIELARLLRSPNGLATAVVLQEIFGEPRCRRNHH